MKASASGSGRRPLTHFFILSYAIAWLAWSPLVLSRAGVGLLPYEGSMWLILPGSYAPLLAAAIVRWREAGDLRFATFAPSLPRLGAGLALGAALVVLGFVVLPGLWLAVHPAELRWSALALYPATAGHALLMAGPIGEEPGWRGFALPRLQARFGPVKATLLLGLLWAAWHLPLFLVPRWNATPFWTYALLVTGFAFTLNLAFNVSRGSTLVAILLHALFNGSAAVLGTLLAGATETRDLLPAGVVLALAFLAIGIVAVAVTRGRLGPASPPPGTTA